MNMPLRRDDLPDPPRGTAHVIETLQWACRFADARSAARHQQRLSRFLKGHGARVIHELFEQLSPPGEVWRIDRLDLDLGRLRPDAPPEQWAQQLREYLWNELLRLRGEAGLVRSLTDGTRPAWTDAADASASTAEAPRPASEHSLDHFLYYVEYGHLPWSAGTLAGRDLAGWLERLARRDGSRLWAQLQQLPLAEQTLQRLSRITPHHGLQALLEARHTGLSAGLTRLDEQVLLPLQARGRLSAYQLQQLQQAWRVAGLRALWGNSSSVLSADRQRQLVLTLTQSLNRMLGPLWRALLKPGAQANDARAPSDVAQQLLQGVLGTPADDKASSHGSQDQQPRLPAPLPSDGRPSTSDRQSPAPPLQRTTRAALARLLALLDGPANEANSARALGLLNTLSAHCPDELGMHLQSWARRHARRANWSRQMAPSLLWPLLQCLSQQSADTRSEPQGSREGLSMAAAPWAESLRQFVLARLSRTHSSSGTLSQWQSRLIEYTLRHLAMGLPMPRDHSSWQRLWQSAWKELDGNERAKESKPKAIDAGRVPSALPQPHGGDTEEHLRGRDLADEVKRWLFTPGDPQETPWWVEAPGNSLPVVHAELMTRLRARSLRLAAASLWPEYRKLQLLHLLMLPVPPASRPAALPAETGRTDAAGSRWRWVTEEIRDRVGAFGFAVHTPNGAPAASAWADTTGLEQWLWLTAIEWAMQPAARLPSVAALNKHWDLGLRALGFQETNASPNQGRGGEIVPTGALPDSAMSVSTEPSSEPSPTPKDTLKNSSPWRTPGSRSLKTLDSGIRRNDETADETALVLRFPKEPAPRHSSAPTTPTATTNAGLDERDGAGPAPSGADSITDTAPIEPRTSAPLALNDLDGLLDAPSAQWTPKLRLQVASLLQNPRTRAAWLSRLPLVRQRQLLQRQYPAALSALVECVDLLLAASQALEPERDKDEVARRLWRFLAGHLFGEGGSPEPGPLARRFALYRCRNATAEGPGGEALSFVAALAALDKALSNLDHASAPATSARAAVVRAMRQALVPPPSRLEQHELQQADDPVFNDSHGHLDASVDAAELRHQLDHLLTRVHAPWRAADRLRLMSLLDHDEACTIWLSHHEETQRWRLLDRHLAGGASELRAITVLLIAATQALQLTGSIDEARSECWRFLAQHLFVDGLAAEPGLLVRRYAMSLRHQDLDADAGRSVSFQRWAQRLADVLQRDLQTPGGPPPSQPSVTTDPQPALPVIAQSAASGSQTPVLATMIQALRRPPTRSEQWEASLTIESRNRLRGDRSTNRPEPMSARTSASTAATSDADTGSSPTISTATTLSSTPTGRAARPRRHELPGDERNPIYVANAGLVLLANYSQRLFGMLQLLSGSDFTDEAARWRAIHALEYLVHGHNDGTEPEWVLTKLLCGVPMQQPVPPCEGLDEACHDLLDGLLRAVIANWKAIGNTSVAGLRESFLQRRGRLVRRIGQEADHWQLKVEQRPFDLLIDRLPWGFSTIKLPWMPGALHVDWR